MDKHIKHAILFALSITMVFFGGYLVGSIDGREHTKKQVLFILNQVIEQKKEQLKNK